MPCPNCRDTGVWIDENWHEAEHHACACGGKGTTMGEGTEMQWIEYDRLCFRERDLMRDGQAKHRAELDEIQTRRFAIRRSITPTPAPSAGAGMIDTLADRLVAAITGEAVREVIARLIHSVDEDGGFAWDQMPDKPKAAYLREAEQWLAAIAPEVRARVRAVLEGEGDE